MPAWLTASAQEMLALPIMAALALPGTCNSGRFPPLVIASGHQQREPAFHAEPACRSGTREGGLQASGHTKAGLDVCRGWGRVGASALVSQSVP